VRIPRQPPHIGRLRPDNLTTRQAELLEEIQALYLRDGFSRHTLDALASELRCSKMTLYTLAPSREQLAVAVLRRFFEAVSADITHQTRMVAGPEEKIEVTIRAMADGLLEMSPVCFHEMLGFEPTRQVYEGFARGHAETLAGLLDRASEGAPRVPGPFVAELVKVAIESACAGELEADTAIPPSAAVDHLVSVALLSLPPRRVHPRPTPRR
jgi:AcrR family transcriptional regulator